MTLEAGFAAAAAILEMLLQSHHGMIRVFPTLHPTWREAAFVNLRTEGAFLVSATVKDGEISFVEIISEAGGQCRVRNPFDAECVLRNLASGKSRRLKGDVLAFPTKRGGQYRLVASAARLAERDGTMPTMRRPAQERNWFGTKRHPKF
jgi:alpha-L-fucosidase 2